MSTHTEVFPPVHESSTTPAAPRSRRTGRALVLGVLSAGVLLAACSSSSTPATTTTTAPGSATTSPNGGGAAYLAADLKAPAGTLAGSGSTFVQPFFTKAFYTYSSKNQGVQINYQGVGSGAGITAFEAGTVNFAASDVPMAAADLAKVPASSGPVVQIPDILGGVTLSYDLPGVTKRLKLDGPTIAGIFSGTIKTWNASQIAALNPGVTLPSNAIVPEVRADSSGTTYIFSDYLTSAAPGVWTLGASKTINWPASAVATPKNAGVAGSIKSTPYSIGYVELNYAVENQFTYAAVKNAAGVFVVPSTATVAADAAQKATVTPTSFSIVNQGGATSYPISGYSWAILLQKQTSESTGATLVKVLDWTTQTGGGQSLATALDYVPLPPAVQTYARTQLLTVTGPSGTALLTK
jgi:phosphate transport system substrate-binding protein